MQHYLPRKFLHLGRETEEKAVVGILPPQSGDMRKVDVMSDIHGNLERFESIMRQINLKDEDTLYILGDVIDRYPYGIKILRQIMKMPNVNMLLGNHEYMMMKAIGHCRDAAEERENANYVDLRRWHMNGGDVTHKYLKHIRKEYRAEISE